jgi:hypothetical protein
MAKVFISYRREDSASVAGRIYDRLCSRLNADNIFYDVDTIPYGVDFRKQINEAVQQCNILLAVIGRHWLDASYQEGEESGTRRLDDPADFVRNEIEAALTRGIPVVPVLVENAILPMASDLPVSLQQLCYRNACEVRPGRDFHSDVNRLIRGIQDVLGPLSINYPLKPFQDRQTKKYGLRTSKGIEVLEPHFDYIQDSQYDPDKDIFPMRQDGKWGLLDRQGRVVTEPQYDHITTFFGVKHLAEVQKSKMTGVLDSKGKIVVPMGDYKVAYFHGDIIKVKLHDNSKSGLMTYGRFVLPIEYDQIGPDDDTDAEFGQRRAVLKQHGKVGFVDTQGKIVLEPTYDDIPTSFHGGIAFSEGLVPVRRGKKYGVVDLEGALVIPIKYDEIGPFGNGLAAVKIGGRFGYLDKRGAVAISPAFDAAGKFKHEMAEILSAGNWWKINKQGKCVADGPILDESLQDGSRILKMQCRSAGLNRIDVQLWNHGHYDILITKLSIKVTKQAETFVMPILDPTAEYSMEVDEIGAGNTKYLDISHVVHPGTADRFLINIGTTGLDYAFEVTLFFNREYYIREGLGSEE